MSPSPPASPASGARGVERLLRDLGPRIQRGARLAAVDAVASAGPGRVLATGIPALDALVDGGLPRGRASELSGPPGSGRTSVALALLAHATRAGGLVGVVDGADAFHPASAAAAGVRLERVLWARPPAAAAALRCCERLLGAGGFAAVVLDGAGHETQLAALPTAAWQRLARAAAATDTALVVLSRRRVAGPFADLALELRPARARFSGSGASPRLFEGLEIEAAVARRRRGTPAGTLSVRLDAGCLDAGCLDAGRPDAGPVDAGRDAGPGGRRDGHRAA